MKAGKRIFVTGILFCLSHKLKLLSKPHWRAEYGILMLGRKLLWKGFQMKIWFYRWGPAILIMAIIFFASATPGSKIPEFGFWDIFVKKGGHMLGYALLAVAYCRALNNGKGGTKLQVILAICIAALYAASDEWHQKFTPGRNASLSDVGIDVVGSLIGITVFRLTQRLLPVSNEAAGTCLK